jgi:perosamine synthetase
MADWQVNRKQKKLIKQVLKSGRLTYGDKTRELEERFAKLHGVKYALFTSSGTAALKIALHALKDKYKWKDGDEVIIPAVTFVATMNVVIMNNLQPVLVDVKEDTVNIDPELIEQAITKKTRAILPVHLLGQPAAMKAIVAIAKKHELKDRRRLL